MRRAIIICMMFFAGALQADYELDLYESMYVYALPEGHRLQKNLSKIFSSSKTLSSEKEFEKRGFTILHRRPSTLLVAKHDSLPGYLVKVYLSSSKRSKEENLENLVNRCRGAENIRNLIRQENLRYFTVPNKYIYTTTEGMPVLVATYMDLVSKEESKHAWKNYVTYAELEELYCIISHGYASTLLPANIPYTKKGKFACIDTELPNRVPKYPNAKKHLSKKMGEYWDKLVKAGGGSR